MFASMNPCTEIRGEENVRLRPGDRGGDEAGVALKDVKRFSTCSTSSECVVGPVIHLVEPVRRVWKFPLKHPSFQVIAKHRLSDRHLIVRKTDRIVGIPQIEVEGNTPHYDQP